MNGSQTNSPSATEAVPTSSLSGSENSEKAPDTPPANEADTSTPDTQSSPSPQPSKAFEIFTRIKHTIGAQTHLSEVNIAVAAFWVIWSVARRNTRFFQLLLFHRADGY
jgi:hypothetical protein